MHIHKYVEIRPSIGIEDMKIANIMKTFTTNQFHMWTMYNHV
jgi:hypothetical protein